MLAACGATIRSCWCVLVSDPLLSPSGPAGVTTVVTGNCGVGCAPTRATEADREFMIGMLGAIEVSQSNP